MNDNDKSELSTAVASLAQQFGAPDKLMDGIAAVVRRGMDLASAAEKDRIRAIVMPAPFRQQRIEDEGDEEWGHTLMALKAMAFDITTAIDGRVPPAPAPSAETQTVLPFRSPA